MAKRVSKIMYHGTDIPVPADENHLNGLNPGELFICDDDLDPSIYILTASGHVKKISGDGSKISDVVKSFMKIIVPVDATGNVVFLEDGETPDFENKTGAVVALMVSNKMSFCSQSEITAYYKNGASGEDGENFSGTLVSLKDVKVEDLKDKQVLVWDEASGKWINATGGVGASTWDQLTGKPSWIGSSKPLYQLSEIEGAPSASKMNAWDDAANKRHSHNNLTNVLQNLTENHLNMLINLCNYVSFDSYGNITFEGNVIGKKEGTFFGSGTNAGGSGSTGGGESGGEGSGGGYEDGGNTGGDTGGGSTGAISEKWVMHMVDKMSTSPRGYYNSADRVIYHPDYFDKATEFAGKTIKKVIMRANTTGSSTLYIYAWYGSNYKNNYHTLIGSVTGVNNTEISCNISVPANARIAIKNSVGLAYALGVTDRYGYIYYDSSVSNYYFTAQMNMASVFVDFYLE